MCNSFVRVTSNKMTIHFFRSCLLGLLLLLLLHVTVVFSTPPCQFAPNFKVQDILTSVAARQSFLEQVMRWEGNFHAIAFNNVTGMTDDGHEIDWTTGELADPLHYWSAPSKESIHFMMLAIALDPLADNAFNSKMASVFLSLYLPCMASCMVTVRELGLKNAAKVIAMNLAAALVFASGLNLAVKFL